MKIVSPLTETIQNILKKVKTFTLWHSRKVQLSFLAGCIIAGITLIYYISQNNTIGFTAIVSAMMVLCGLLTYDIISRRSWEKKLSAELKHLSDYHDRLVREVARNRSDLSRLKESLGETALMVEKQGRNMHPTGSVEARMIETIISQLGQMGEKPRPAIETRHDGEILELETSPPPSNALLKTEVENVANNNFDKLSDAVVLDLVRRAVRYDDIEIFMQPIVNLPPRKPKMQEIFARIKAQPGSYIPAARYIDIAQNENMIPALDNLLLLRCLQMIKNKSVTNTPYFINISANTLHDKGFMGDLVSFLSQYKNTASNIIFELPQKEIESLEHDILPILEGLSTLGCSFSMDRVLKRQINISFLKKHHIRFLKLDANWLLKQGKSREGFKLVSRLKKQLDAHGIDLIVEKIETESQIRELLDFGIDFGQGYLFGKPDIADIQEKAA